MFLAAMRARVLPSANTVDKGWVVLQSFHLGADRSEFGHREIDKRRFESRKIAASESLQNIDFLAVQRGENADEIVGFRPVLKPSTSDGSASGSVFALRTFCAIVSASSERLIRE